VLKKIKKVLFLMWISYFLFYLFSSFAILSSLFVIITKNPIYSVLFLIFTFTNVSCLLFLFNFDFLPVIFLIVYVGAIAVLFLFVLMMLNIKSAELQDNYTNYVPYTFFFCCLFLVEFVFLLRSEFFFLEIWNQNSIVFLNEFLNTIHSNTDFNNYFGVFSNLKAVSVALFSNYLFSFLLASYILLLAMIAVIALTLHKNFISKKQNVYSQLMVNYKNTILNYA
jgi:NADH-quinone oxidoreductase subunit J